MDKLITAILLVGLSTYIFTQRRTDTSANSQPRYVNKPYKRSLSSSEEENKNSAPVEKSKFKREKIRMH